MPRLLYSLMLLLLFLPAPARATRAGILGNRENFYYLDHPESVYHPGILATLFLPRGRRARIFFHYRNCTPDVQQFWVRSVGPLANTNWACTTALDPGSAGSSVARSFFTREPQRAERLVGLWRLVRPGMVVSGIVEGVPVWNTRVICRMGDGERVRFARVQVTRHISWNFLLPLSRLRPTAHVRIGDRQAGHIYGDYGSTVRICATVPRPSWLRVVLSPRGGNLQFVYRHNGVVHMLPGCKAYGNYELYTLPVTSTDVLEVIPLGGYCYPVELSYTLLGSQQTHRVIRRRRVRV